MAAKVIEMFSEREKINVTRRIEERKAGFTQRNVGVVLSKELKNHELRLVVLKPLCRILFFRSRNKNTSEPDETEFLDLFKKRIGSESYNMEKSLISDLWQIYVATREKFDISVIERAVNIAKLAVDRNNRKIIQAINYIFHCIKSLDEFENDYSERPNNKETFANFIVLLGNCGANDLVVIEVRGFLAEIAGRPMDAKICVDAYLSMLNCFGLNLSQSFTSSQTKFLSENNQCENLQEFSIICFGNQTSEEVAKAFLELCINLNGESQAIFKAIELIKESGRKFIAYDCEKCIKAIKDSVAIRREET